MNLTVRPSLLLIAPGILQTWGLGTLLSVAADLADIGPTSWMSLLVQGVTFGLYVWPTIQAMELSRMRMNVISSSATLVAGVAMTTCVEMDLTDARIAVTQSRWEQFCGMGTLHMTAPNGSNWSIPGVRRVFPIRKQLIRLGQSSGMAA